MGLLKPRGQEHLLQWWGELSGEERQTLLSELESIPWGILDPVIPTHVLSKPESVVSKTIQPARVTKQPPKGQSNEKFEAARHRGRELLGAGRVAAFTVAGGQGTRLGFDGPKGMVLVTPVGEKSLFELFALTVRGARDRFRAVIPWYIMTSPANHGETLAYFRANQFFGLPEDDVVFFSQGMLPAFDFQGRVLLSSKSRLGLAPDGHGGSLKALVESGSLRDMQRRGITTISYFQVDNPLVKPFDPVFIGLHSLTCSEMSTKVATKADDLEKVGNVCLVDDHVTVVEYSDFPAELAHARDEHGRRVFDAGNLAIHLLDVSFVDRVVAKSFQMPFRRAEKVVPYVDEAGVVQMPERPNAVKLETFVFDVLPLARNPLVLEVDRAEEFSPVKNSTGPDSLESSKRDQVLRACRWLEDAGVSVPRDGRGEPDLVVAISPTFALDKEDVVIHKDRVPPLKPRIQISVE